MYKVQHCMISDRSSWIYEYCDRYAILSWHLYNAALFRIRQIFTGWDKECLTPNEKEVFDEVSVLEESFPSIRVRRVISYTHLEKLMRVTHSPDFFSGLPMQTSQAVVRQAVTDFKNWLASVREYKKEPGSFLGRPGMPRYKKSACTFTMTNQDAVLYPDGLKLPCTKNRVWLSCVVQGVLKEVKVVPCYGRYILSLTFETPDVPAPSCGSHVAAIDFGTDNIAAIVCTDGSSKLYKGGAILSENRYFAMERARLSGIITKGHAHVCAHSRQLDSLSFHHANFVKDQLHKISSDIVKYCLQHGAGTLVLGENRFWKQGCRIGNSNNQSFIMMPVSFLKKLIEYKACNSGITVIRQEESYTSKASFVDGDYIPVYGTDDENAVFSGRRIRRGLYRTSGGILVNADLNAAANILKKAMPCAWDVLFDGSVCPSHRYDFLIFPEVSGFHELNPQGIPVKGIAAA